MLSLTKRKYTFLYQPDPTEQMSNRAKFDEDASTGQFSANGVSRQDLASIVSELQKPLVPCSK